MNWMENEEFQKFSKCITSIRALAIIGIIIFHQQVVSKFNVNESTQLLFVHFSRANIGVDIFVLLSGMILTIMLVNNQNHSWKNWYKRRAIRIFPILMISIIFIAVFDVIFLDSDLDLNSILILMSGVFKIPTFTYDLPIREAFWFIPFILSCYLIFPFIIYFIRKNFKLTLCIVILLYFIIVIFSPQIYEFSALNMEKIFDRELEGIYYDAYVPRYFDFIFGMLLGFWIGKNEMSNLNKLKDERLALLLLNSLIILYFLCLFLSFYLNDPQQIIPRTQIYLALYFVCYPLLSLSFVVFMINILYNQPKANKLLELPGKASYEIFLTHLVAINIITMIMFKMLLLSMNILNILVYIILIITFSIILVIPFHFLANKIKTEKRLHPFLLLLSVILIIYSIIFHLFYKIIKYTDMMSAILIGAISISLILIVFIYKKKKENKEGSVQTFGVHQSSKIKKIKRID